MLKLCNWYLSFINPQGSFRFGVSGNKVPSCQVAEESLKDFQSLTSRLLTLTKKVKKVPPAAHGRTSFRAQAALPQSKGSCCLPQILSVTLFPTQQRCLQPGLNVQPSWAFAQRRCPCWGQVQPVGPSSALGLKQASWPREQQNASWPRASLF